MKLGLASLQGVLFINNLNLTDKLFVAQLLGKLKSIDFSNNPTVLPLPPDAPLEVPRIILRSNDGVFNLNISPTRIDLFYNNKQSDKEDVPVGDIKEIEKKIIEILKEISEILITKLSVNIPRLAVVSNYLIKLKESSKKYMLSKFMKEGVVGDVKEIQLNFLTNKEVNKYKLNEWIKFNTLRNLKNVKDDTAVLLSIDLNSLTEINYNFSNDSIDEFLKICFSLIQKEMDLYITSKSEGQ